MKMSIKVFFAFVRISPPETRGEPLATGAKRALSSDKKLYGGLKV